MAAMDFSVVRLQVATYKGNSGAIELQGTDNAALVRVHPENARGFFILVHRPRELRILRQSCPNPTHELHLTANHDIVLEDGHVSIPNSAIHDVEQLARITLNIRPGGVGD